MRLNKSFILLLTFMSSNKNNWKKTMCTMFFSPKSYYIKKHGISNCSVGVCLFFFFISGLSWILLIPRYNLKMLSLVRYIAYRKCANNWSVLFVTVGGFASISLLRAYIIHENSKSTNVQDTMFNMSLVINFIIRLGNLCLTKVKILT